MRLEHTIFRAPLDPGIVLDKREIPEHYRQWPEGRDLANELPVWSVQAGDFPATIDVGLVSSPWGFEDSPDAEWLSSGINSKGPSSVALGRQGNLFLWGFAGDPRQMSESARRVFLNVVCYMKRFDAHVPLVHRMMEEGRISCGREAVLLNVGYLDLLAADPVKNAWVRDSFPPGLLERFASDRAQLETYYRENMDYVRLDGRSFAVDEDLVALGISNRDPRLLDALARLLVKDVADERALRLLERYVRVTPAEFPAWLEENRSRLFFSDVGGFRWFVDPYATAGAPVAAGAADSGR